MSSSEDDVDYESFRDVVECDYIRKCYNVATEGPDEKNPDVSKKKNGFEEHLINKLFNRLEREIELIEPDTKMKASSAKQSKRALTGIKLFSDSSKLLTGEEEEEQKRAAAEAKEESRESEKKLKRKIERKEEKLAQERAKEVAVSGELILSGHGARGWKDGKKPRITWVSIEKITETGAMNSRELEEEIPKLFTLKPQLKKKERD